MCVGFSDNYIAYGSRLDYKVYVHNIGGNWNKETELTEAGYFIYSLDFSNNNNYIAYSTSDYVYIHYVGNGWNKVTGLTSSGNGPIQSVKFSNNNNYIAFTDGDNKVINVHKTSDWSKVTGLTINNSSRINFSPNDDFLIVGTFSDSNLLIYKTIDWNLHQIIKNSSNHETISLNDNNLTFNNGNKVEIYNKEKY